MAFPDSACLPTEFVIRIAPGSRACDGDVPWFSMLEACVEHLPRVDAGSVLLLTDEGTLRFVASVGLDASALDHVRIPPTALRPSSEHGVLIGFRVEDALLDPTDRETLRGAARGDAVVASMSVALRPAGHLIGYLQLDSHASQAFGDADVGLARAVGELVGAVVARHPSVAAGS